MITSTSTCLELVHKVLGHPGASGPLAVLADWLEERGHPMGSTLRRSLIACTPEVSKVLVQTLLDPDLELVAIEEQVCHNTVEGLRSFEVPVFRFGPFARALGLPPGRRSPAAELVMLPAPGHDGRFVMGSPKSEPHREGDEEPHEVVIDRPYLIARTLVSQRVYRELLAGSVYRGKLYPPEKPAIWVSWEEASSWCSSLDLRLPSEAEWEFAARGGTQTAYCFGDKLETRDAIYGGSPTRDESIDRFPPNAFGLLGVHGTLWEWTADSYQADYRHTPRDGSPHQSSIPDRVCRGGCWDTPAADCRSARRARYGRTDVYRVVGFRPARSLPGTD